MNKTKEIILNNIVGPNRHTRAELEAMQVYADQEKRKEAIAFLDDCRNYERENRELIGFDERSSEEFYDIYLQSITNKTNQP